jgi:fatty-acyl-CoA synthase
MTRSSDGNRQSGEWMHTGDLATIDAEGYCNIVGQIKDMVIGGGENATPEEIRAFCQGRIAHYKVPRYVEFVDGLPMTVTGKIQKFLMRQMKIGELSLSLRETA